MEEHKRALMGPLKCHIPPIHGGRDVETYLDWEMKYGGANFVGKFVKGGGDMLILANLEREMRTRFLPISYARDLYNKLQRRGVP
ncbi:hypothetical protein CR513_07305, partial [Mucuna pruriens]